MESIMKLLQKCWSIIWSNKHYLVVIIIQFSFSGMSLFSKASITTGMNPYIFVVYRQALATIALAPIAFFTERVDSGTLSYSVICKAFLVSFVGITMSLNLYYIALHYVSATFAVAINNLGPAITFTLAVCLRAEKVSLKEKHGFMKLVGTGIGICGAVIFTFVKGPPMHQTIGHDVVKQSSAIVYSKGNWIKGSFILLLCNITWSLWLVLQGPLLKQYPAKLRLTLLQCFFSSLQSAIWALVHHRDLSSWKLGWDINLISLLYCGVVVTGITYWLLVWVVGQKGPVFPSLFNPLALFITAAFSAIFFKEVFHWGSFCGAMLLMMGQYGILWGKNIEEKMKNSGQKPTITVDEKIRGNEKRSEETKEATTIQCITCK